MGDTLKSNYAQLYEEKRRKHFWQLIYNEQVLREFDTFPELSKAYEGMKKAISPSDKELLTWKLCWKD